MPNQDGHSSLQNTCKLLAEQSLNLRAWPGYRMTSSFVAWRPDLSLSLDEVDLELLTVTFAGLTKPHCNFCSSPYHAEDVCPSADLNGKSRHPQTVL